MGIREWLSDHGGVAHRRDANRANFSDYRIRRARELGQLRMLGGGWITTAPSGDVRVMAIELGGRVACVSAARLRGLWVHGDDRLHVSVPPRSSVSAPPGVRLHRSIPRTVVGRTAAIESVIDMLEHVATCLPFEQAAAVWESAIHKGLIEPELLARVKWRRLASRALALAATRLSDSGLETMIITRMREWGIAVRQQVRILGHPVDLLIGERLIVQIDGWEFHSSSADRTRDNRHDARLRLAGYTVIRFSYAEVVHGWEAMDAELQVAVAQGLHRA